MNNQINEKMFISDWVAFIDRLPGAIENEIIKATDAVWHGPKFGDAVISDTLDMHEAYKNYTFGGFVRDYL